MIQSIVAGPTHTTGQIQLGQDPEGRLALPCLAERSHLLIEGPGMGKITQTQR